MSEQPQDFGSGSGSPTTQALIEFLDARAAELEGCVYIDYAPMFRAAADALRSLQAKDEEIKNLREGFDEEGITLAERCCGHVKAYLNHRLEAAEAEVARLTQARDTPQPLPAYYEAHSVEEAAERLRETLKSDAGHIAYVDDEINALINAARAEGALLGPLPPWQPLASCPKMRTVLLYAVTDVDADGSVKNWKMATGWWHEGYDDEQSKARGVTPWNWDGHQLKVYELMPTHWLPLPAGPLPSPQEAR